MKPPKDLGKAIKSGYMPMFMTGTEIKEHFAPHEKDKKNNETDEQLWGRKLNEAKQTGAERFGEESFERSSNGFRSLNGPLLARKGIKANTSIESVAKEKGIEGVVHVQDHVGYPSDKQQILGGHHRIALSAEQFKEHIFPISYARNLDAAKDEPTYK